MFGICLGHQILGLALGARTLKLPFGHHGGNHPVLDKTTGKVEITSQNHGFVVDAATLPSGVHVTHENLFDHSNEGIAVEGKPIFSVQYHPEASPGPHDASYLFARFRDAADEEERSERRPRSSTQVIEELYARHTADAEAAGVARREYEERRGKVHQDDELWEPWSAAFVEWYVVERVGAGRRCRRRRATYRELRDAGDPSARAIVGALVTSQRSLFEVRAIAKQRPRSSCSICSAAPSFTSTSSARCIGVEVGDVAELRLVGVGGEVRFGRTFIYHPKAARAAIVERARGDAREGRVAARRDRSDRAAARPGHALSPHGAGARLRARLADHGMKRVALASCSLLRRGVLRTPTRRVDRPEAIEVDRDAPPPGRAELGFDGGAPIDGLGASACSSATSIGRSRLHTTSVETFPVEHRETLALGGALALGAVGGRRRAAAARRTRSAIAARASATTARSIAGSLGDLALGARLRVAERAPIARLRARRADARRPATITTSRARRATPLAWMLIGRVALPAGIVVAGDRRASGFAAREVQRRGSARSATSCSAASARRCQLPAIRGLWCDANHVRARPAEVVGVLGDDVGGQARAIARRGAHRHRQPRSAPWLAVACRVGKGLDDQIGAPRFRAMLELVYQGHRSSASSRRRCRSPTSLAGRRSDD